MICEFCKHEFSAGLAECPYCHKIVDKVPEKMTEAERDTYDGVTVELDSDGNYTGTSYEGGAQEENIDEEVYGDRRGDGKFGTGRNSGVHFYHTGGSILWLILFILIILAAVFFLLPAFLVIAAIGAVIIFVVGLLNRFL